MACRSIDGATDSCAVTAIICRRSSSKRNTSPATHISPWCRPAVRSRPTDRKQKSIASAPSKRWRVARTKLRVAGLALDRSKAAAARRVLHERHRRQSLRRRLWATDRPVSRLHLRASRESDPSQEAGPRWCHLPGRADRQATGICSRQGYLVSPCAVSDWPRGRIVRRRYVSRSDRAPR